MHTPSEVVVARNFLNAPRTVYGSERQLQKDINSALDWSTLKLLGWIVD